MIDKEGKQTAKYKAGLHNVSVKVVDNDGLENVENDQIESEWKSRADVTALLNLTTFE